MDIWELQSGITEHHLVDTVIVQVTEVCQEAFDTELRNITFFVLHSRK